MLCRNAFDGRPADGWPTSSTSTTPTGPIGSGSSGATLPDKDLVHWTHHPIALTPSKNGPDRQGCFSGVATIHDGMPTIVYFGRYEDDRFFPETHARLNWPGGHLIAPITMLDPNGRRLLFGWINEGRGNKTQRAVGWAGVMTLPRVLWLGEDGTLRVKPAPEVEILRINHRRHEGIPLKPGEDLVLEDIRGAALEIALTIEPAGAGVFGLRVRCSPDAAEQTTIVCDPGAGLLKVDGTRASAVAISDLPDFPRVDKDCRVQAAPFKLRDGESLRLRVFLDRSVLEVFANDRPCITQRIYPSRSDSLGVRLFAAGGAAIVTSLEAWEMVGAHD